MAIPWDWLLRQVAPGEVEDELAELRAPDLWIRSWRMLLDQMAPDDQLWEYGATEYAATVEESPEVIAGFEQILDGESLDRIGLSESWERIIGVRAGYALIRGDEIIDWIEAPP